ncbi:hypothetical protein Tco_0854540 [Tanacetum coccineum]
MAILVILISLNSPDESVGSSPSRIILFGTIPVETPTIPSVVPTLPHISPFLGTDSSKTSSDSSERPPSQNLYEVTVARTSDSTRTTRITSPTSCSRQPIPLGRPYHTQPNEVRKMLTTRKRVRALPVGRLASGYLPDHSSSDNFLSDDSSPDSSSDLSSDYSSDSSSGHSIPDSSFSPKDSSFDAPATISARPSHKRCRFPAASVLLATLVPGALSPVRADLLLPRRRIREVITISDYDDSIVGIYEAYIGPDIDSDVQANIDADTAAVKTAAALEVGIRIKREDEAKKEAESRDRGTIRIGVDRVLDIESA